MTKSHNSSSKGVTFILLLVVMALAGVAVYVGIQLQNTQDTNPTPTQSSSDYCSVDDTGRDVGESCNGISVSCCGGLVCMDDNVQILEGDNGSGICRPASEVEGIAMNQPTTTPEEVVVTEEPEVAGEMTSDEEQTQDEATEEPVEETQDETVAQRESQDVEPTRQEERTTSDEGGEEFLVESDSGTTESDYSSASDNDAFVGGKDESTTTQDTNIVGGKDDGTTYNSDQGSSDNNVVGGKDGGELPNTSINAGYVLPIAGIVLTFFAIMKFDAIRNKALRFKYSMNTGNNKDVSGEEKHNGDVLKEKSTRISQTADEVKNSIS